VRAAPLSAKLPEAGILRVIKTFAGCASRPAFIYPRPNSINQGITGLVKDKVVSQPAKKAPGLVARCFYLAPPGISIRQIHFDGLPGRGPKQILKVYPVSN
jgi:hypothetical protein